MFEGSDDLRGLVTHSLAGGGRVSSVHLNEPVLAYGEVRVGPRFLAIGVESVFRSSADVRTLYERAVDAVGVDPDDVLVVRITEEAIEVDAIESNDLGWPVRTWRVALALAFERGPPRDHC